MKKYAIALLFIMNALNGMSKPACAEIALHDASFDHFLTTYNLPIENRSIFHIGCSTGNNSLKLAQKASRVHAFDVHQNCIDFARNKHQNLNNIFFEHCSTTHFDCPRHCDLAVIDCTVIDTYTTTNENRKTLFQCINQHLSQNGEIFISAITHDNQLHPHIIAAMDIVPTIQELMPRMTEEEITTLMIPVYPHTQELRAILEESGFKNITTEEQNITLLISETNLRNAYTNIVIQNPMFDHIQDGDVKIALGKLFVQSYIDTLQKNNDGKLLEPMITTIIRARKK